MGREVRYVNVKKESGALERMLEFSGGKRRVPVIVENEQVSVGYQGGY